VVVLVTALKELVAQGAPVLLICKYMKLLSKIVGCVCGRSGVQQMLYSGPDFRGNERGRVRERIELQELR
jgi:hypothetical protein